MRMRGVEREQFMPTPIINSERLFQLWGYTVSHGQLLLRSVKADDSATRIDVFFHFVRELHMPALLQGLSVQEDPGDHARNLCSVGVRESPSFDHGLKVYTVTAKDFSGYVAASSCSCHEDEGEYNEPSF